MVYIIIKTDKNLQSELQSVHNTKEEASYQLTRLCDNTHINRIINGSVLKVYENNYVMRNNSLFLYQIIEIEKKTPKKHEKENEKKEERDKYLKIIKK